MAKAGRKRRQGSRTRTGRLSRAGVPRYDKGTEHAQAMQALYGTDGSDAIGRAYRSGLLGKGSEAKALIDTARRIANAYWRAYETGKYRCTLADREHGTIVSLDHEKVRLQEEWLRECLESVSSMGVRRQFDQLVIDVHPDSGPAWLDRLCYAQRTKGDADIADRQALRAALDALEYLAT